MRVTVSNGSEWLLKPESSSELMTFTSLAEAVSYLKAEGFRDDQISSFKFHTGGCNECQNEQTNRGTVFQFPQSVPAAVLTDSAIKYLRRLLMKVSPILSVLWRVGVI